MFRKNNVVFLVLLGLLTTASLRASSEQPQKPKDTVVIVSGKNAYIPFTFFKQPTFQVINNQLNVSVTDRTGDMIQVNGIDILKLKKGILPKSGYRVVYISQKLGTLTDDNDTNNGSLIEIKCNDTKPGTSISIGLKSRVASSGKKLTVYATLSGIIPPYTYQNTLSK